MNEENYATVHLPVLQTWICHGYDPATMRILFHLLSWICGIRVYCMRSDTKKTRLTLQLGNQEWEGKDKQTAIEHVLTCHSVTRLSSITLLSTSGRIF